MSHRLSALSLALLAALPLTSVSAQNQPDASYAPCPLASSISPIDIAGTEAVRTHRLQPHYRVTELAVKNTQTGLQIQTDPASRLHIADKSFVLSHVAIRTPAEHSVVRLRYPLELQFIHQGETGHAVISVLVEIGAANRAAGEIWSYLPLERGQTNRPANVQVNVRDLLPDNLAYFRYQGSLTEPPCSRETAWYVLKTPIQMSQAQVSAVTAVQGRNAMMTRPRGNRIILDTEQ